MGYPARWRNSPQGSPAPAAPRPSGEVLRFPIRRPFSNGRFGPATQIPGRASFGLRPPISEGIRPPPRVPGAGRVLTWIAVGIGLAETFNALTGGVPSWVGPSFDPSAGWSTVCGPAPWPGPPYRFARQAYGLAAGPSFSIQCGAGGQSVAGFNSPPNPTDATVFIAWGPNEGLLPLVRVYWSEKYTRSTSTPGLTNVQWLQPIEGQVIAYTGYGPLTYRPTDPIAEIAPIPVWVTPWLPPSDFPQSTERGDAAGVQGPRLRAPDDVVRTDTRNQVAISPYAPPQEPPRPRERERKTTGLVGRAIVVGFRVMSTVGSVNSAVDAFWRAIPRQYRSTGRQGWRRKYEELWHNWNRIELDDAFANAFNFWVKYKLAGMFYGRAFKATQSAFGERTGAYLYRALASAVDAGEHELIERRRAQWARSRRERARKRREGK